MRYVVMCLIVLSLSACASTTAGNKFDQETFSHFVKGKTTYDEVVRELGEPSSLIKNADGSKTAEYRYLTRTTKPESYIPIVGGFLGGYNSEQNTAVLMFNKKSVLTDYSSSKSHF